MSPMVWGRSIGGMRGRRSTDRPSDSAWRTAWHRTPGWLRSQSRAVAPDHQQLTDSTQFTDTAKVNGTAPGCTDIDPQGSTQARDAGTDHHASDRAGVVLASAAGLATERRGIRAQRTDLPTKELPRPARHTEP